MTCFPKQRKLMGSSAQNSSGVHWCRHRVRFNEVPEKVPEVPEKVREASVQSQVRFDRVPEKVPEKVWEALVQSQVRVPEKVPGSLAAKPSQESGSMGSGEGSGEGLQSQVRFNTVSERFGEGSGEGLGGFGAEPGQVQQGSGEGSGEGSRKPWCRDRLGSTGFRRRLRRRIRRRSGSTGFRRQGLRGFGAEPGQVKQGFGEGSGEVSRKPWCKAKSGSTGSGEGCREGPGGPGEGFGNLWARSGSTGSTGFPALGFAARFRKICKDKTLRLLGIPPKLTFFEIQDFDLCCLPDCKILVHIEYHIWAPGSSDGARELAEASHHNALQCRGTASAVLSVSFSSALVLGLYYNGTLRLENLLWISKHII